MYMYFFMQYMVVGQFGYSGLHVAQHAWVALEIDAEIVQHRYQR